MTRLLTAASSVAFWLAVVLGLPGLLLLLASSQLQAAAQSTEAVTDREVW